MCSHAATSFDARLLSAAPRFLRRRCRQRRDHEQPAAHGGEDAQELAALELEPVWRRFGQLVAFDFDLEIDGAIHRRASPFELITPAYESALPRPHSLGGQLHGADDARVGAAAADVAVHDAGDVRLGRSRSRAQQAHRRHHHARRAVAALKRFGIEERLLDRMQLLAARALRWS